MNVPVSWLKQYIDVDSDPKDIAERFTFIGYMLDKPAENVGDDVVLDLEVRQNRSDCLSIIGLARELSAVMNVPLKEPDLDSSNLDGSSDDSHTTINIQDEDLCYRFNTVTMTGLKNTDSPDWLKKHLEAYGIASKNALVDITNYVMVEYGQPLHAFDADKISNGVLTIRRAQENESITLLGSKQVQLTSEDLVIVDDEGPVAIAGIMGGEEKGISNETTSIILEAATYNQASIRRSTQRHDIRTEASTRLEKFLHPHLTEVALARAVQLIKEIIGGEVIDHTDAYQRKAETTSITFRPASVEKLGGIVIDTDEVLKILSALGIATEKQNDSEFACTIPYYRTDLEQEADIIEEIIRIHGYDKIRSRPLSGSAPRDIQSTSFDFEEKVKDIMVSLGYDEQITEPLVYEENPENDPVLLENSLTSEKTMLRTTLQHSLSHALKNRMKYGDETIKLFEVGKIYAKNGSFIEERVLGCIVKDPDFDFQRIKGDIEMLFEMLGYVYADAFIRVTSIGNNSVYISVSLDNLLENGKETQERVMTSPPQLLLQDFSLDIATDAKIGDILLGIENADDLIYSAALKGEPHIKDDQTKNILVSVAFHSPDMTLSSKDVEPLRDKILAFARK